ncbi:uncharacterized protein [Primulina huaijiensis]|uniref:uncharacterized protein n=1 Tax=Primulina huaijiensis TaxID=1492673 RepID=UPI003CC73DEA
MENNQEDAYLCPSFNCYTAEKLAEIAVKVATEDEENDEDGAFEFTLVLRDEEVVAYDGQIRSIFPVFNRDLVSSDSAEAESLGIPVTNVRSDRNHLSSCSSSEGDDLETVPPGTYCIWRPSPVLCKKSKSTGSKPRSWKFSDLMRRSNSDGKDNYVFLTPKHRSTHDQKPRKLIEASKIQKVTGTKSISGGGAPGSPSPHEVLYTWNRAMNAEKRKKSYLPYTGKTL